MDIPPIYPILLEGELDEDDGIKPTCQDSGSKRRAKIDSDPIATYIRSYCIRKFSRRDALTALYKVGEEEQVIEFDLSGFPQSSINSDYLKGLSKVLRFESLLSYVALPRLSVENDDIEAEGQNKLVKNIAESSKGKGITSLTTIFKWLKDNHVNLIIRVIVIDDAEPSHSDEAIERCLDGLEVEVWNWKKIDLCSDVIVNVAKETVKEVSLYSSGNNAVLVGWSSEAGLARLSKLEKVHLYVREGLESSKRLEAYLESFKTELKKHKPEVQCRWTPDSAEQSYASGFMEKSASTTIENRWMTCMQGFAHLMKSVQAAKSANPVKIAIIDDGIHTDLDIFTDKIQVGDSFYHLSEFSGGSGAYYVPTGLHGTLMAQLICEVCPVVKLYVAQLQPLSGRDGRRSFTSESATDAINWAVKREVDIISMSWSIDTGGHLKELEKALSDAKSANIIMFCSSIDQGSTTRDNTYPGREPSCIKIGASTTTGEKLTWVSEESQFLLPGENVQLLETHRWSYPQLGPYGSSISTALAAGLAGVLLYCDRLSSSSSTQVDPLRQMGEMADAFKNLSKGTSKFIQVWDYFKPDFKEMIWNPKKDEEGTEATKRHLERLMATVKGR